MAPDAEMPLLQAHNLRKSYVLGKVVVPVLKDAGLQVRAGESLAIVGASGSGKSTLLHVLGGLDHPDSGTVHFRHENLYALSTARRTAWRAREIGFVFQFYHLLSELDVLENVLLPTLIRVSGPVQWGWHWLTREGQGYSTAMRERALELLRYVGLEHRVAHRPMELSGGEQQRVALVRALINKPSLLLADEPTGNLDSATGEQALDILFGLTQTAGHTLIMVTHNDAVAARCDRILRLKDGCLSEA